MRNGASVSDVDRDADDSNDILKRLRNLELAGHDHGQAYNRSQRRNLLDNGEGLVSQRIAINGYSGSPGGRKYIADRWAYTPPAGALGAIYPAYDLPFEDFGRVTIFDSGGTASGTAANLSAAGDYCYYRQLLEGQNLQHLRWGTANAMPLCFSIVMWTTAAGSSVVPIEFERASGRTISRTITIDNTPRRYFVTIPGDTVGVIPNNNTGAFAVNLWFGASTTYNSGGSLNTVWSSGVSASRAYGGRNFFATAATQVYFTGMQLELGTTPTPFEHLRYADALLDCQRYCYVIPNVNNVPVGVGQAIGVNDGFIGIWLPVAMRDRLVGCSTSAAGWVVWSANSAGNVTTGWNATVGGTDPNWNNLSPDCRFLYLRPLTGGGLVAGNAITLLGSSGLPIIISSDI